MSHIETIRQQRMNGFRNYKNLALLLVGVLILLFGYQNCSNVRLSPMKDQITAASTGSFCVAEPAQRDRLTKFMFVVDKSGSNVQSPGPGQPGAGQPPSDPTNMRRAGSIQNFYNDNRANEFIEWGMIAFQGGNTRALIGPAGNQPIFVPGMSPDVQTGIDRLRNEADANGTPYGDALSLTQQAISQDLLVNPNQDNTYMVFFLSDGFPTPAMTESAARLAVRNIVNLSPGRIFLSTGFYTGGASIAEAVNLLRAMADEGKGKFVNFQTSPNFDFNELIVAGPSREPWRIKSLFVYNVTSAICEDGAYDTDSDGDGLCDRDERKYDGVRDPNDPNRILRFNTAKRWSNPSPFDKYGDYFVWRYYKYGEVLGTCNLANGKADDDFDLLTTCEEAHIRNPNPRGVDESSGHPLNPDTDLDGVIDGIETFVFRFTLGSYAMDSFNLFISFDGEETSEQQIKQHRNPEVYDPGAYRYDTRFSVTGINSQGQTCYNFAQNNLLLHSTVAVADNDVLPKLRHGAEENVVLLYYMQTLQRDPNSPGVYQHSYQRIMRAQGAKGLRLDRFTPYNVPRPAGF